MGHGAASSYPNSSPDSLVSPQPILNNDFAYPVNGGGIRRGIHPNTKAHMLHQTRIRPDQIAGSRGGGGGVGQVKRSRYSPPFLVLPVYGVVSLRMPANCGVSLSVISILIGANTLLPALRNQGSTRSDRKPLAAIAVPSDTPLHLHSFIHESRAVRK